MQDNPAERERWMSFAELAEARGISRESAIRLIRKKRWRRQNDNQGHVIALIPEGWADSAERPEDDPADRPPELTGLQARALATLEMAVVTLTAQVAREGARADAAQAQLTEASTRAEAESATLRDLIDGLRSTVGRAEERAVHAERRAVEVEARIAGLEAAAAAAAHAKADADQARAVAREAQEAVRVLKERADVAAALVEAEQHRTGAERMRAEQTEMRLAAVQAEVGEARVATETLRTTIDELKAGQGLMEDMHVRELDQARAHAQSAQDALNQIRQADDARKARGRLRRAWDGWRGR